MNRYAQYQKDPSVNSHGNLRLHLERHQYKRGKHKGDAPADSSRRGRSQFRVAKRGDCMAVVFWQTDILTALPDGTIVLRAGWYADAPSTRAAIEHALHLAGYRVWVMTRNENGYKNTELKVLCKDRWHSFKWEEGTTIGPDGLVNNHGAKFKAYRADKVARKEWANNPKVKEFKALLPLIHATAVPITTYSPTFSKEFFALRRDLTALAGRRPLIEGAIDTPEAWGLLAQYLKCYHDDHKAAWKWVQTHCTQTMRVVVSLDD